MENNITNPTANEVEVELPAEIIQHIQSRMIVIQSSGSKFTGEKEAARTTLVSKSWYRAWSTRPDLVFDRRLFPSHDDPFWEFANTTMKRYEDLNLNIRSLRLVMPADVSLGNELILKAIRLRVVDLTIQILKGDNQFVLPDEVLQSQNLTRLNLSGPWTRNRSFISNLSPIRREEEVTCYNLRSLNLQCMTVNGYLFRDLISRCPLVEKFTLYQVDDSSTSTNLMDDEFDKLHDYFPKLKHLTLYINDALPRHDLWAKFACLKELNINYYRHDDLRICIPSLERTSMYLHDNVSVEFDFPNIRKFKLKGGLPQRFELKTGTTRRDQWEYEIDIIYSGYGQWFSRLSQFMRMLRQSRSRLSIFISPDVGNWDKFSFYPRYVGDGLDIAAVDKLELRGYQTLTPAFLDALLWSCRPKFVKIQNQCLFGLKKVNVEEFQQLRLLPWETIFYHVSSDKCGDDVRFQLN